MFNKNIIRSLLIKHEGVRLTPYTCTAGKLTIGCGRNLEDNGISMDESNYMLNNDISRCIKELERNFEFFKGMSSIRQLVLIDMCFNLGITRLLKFKKTLKAIESKHYAIAAKEMLDSKWADDVGNRARELALMMEMDEEIKLS